MAFRLGVDVGGTFTDLLLIDESSGGTYRAKVPSTPQDSSIGVLNGIERVCDNAGVEPASDHPRDARHHGCHQHHPGREGRPRRYRNHGRATGRCCRSPGPSCPASSRAGSSGPSPSRWRRWSSPSRRRSAPARAAMTVRELKEDDLREKLGHLKTRGIEALTVCLMNAYAGGHPRGADSKAIAQRGDARRAGLDLLRGPAGDVRVRARDHHGRQLLRGAGGAGLCQPTWSSELDAAQDRRAPPYPALGRRARLGRGQPQLAGQRADERTRRRRRRRALDREASRLSEPADPRHGRHVDRRRADPRRRAAQAA